MKIYSKLLLIAISVILLQYNINKQVAKSVVSPIVKCKKVNSIITNLDKIQKKNSKDIVLFSPVEYILSEYESRLPKGYINTIPTEIYYTKKGFYIAFYEVASIYEEGETKDYLCVLIVNSNFKVTDFKSFTNYSDETGHDESSFIFTDKAIYEYRESETFDSDYMNDGGSETSMKYFSYAIDDKGKFSIPLESDKEFDFEISSNEDDIKTIKKLFVICENQKMSKKVKTEKNITYEYFYGQSYLSKLKIKTKETAAKYRLKTYYFIGNQIFFMYEQYFEKGKMINENRYYFNTMLIKVLEGVEKTKPNSDNFNKLNKEMYKSNKEILKIKVDFDKN